MMEDLPEPPATLPHDGIVLAFTHRTPGNTARGFAPGYHFIIRDPRGREAGHINLRIGHSAHVLQVAGHIGYGVETKYRGKGYAGKACLALGPWAATTFHMDLIITADPDNLASLRTIEGIGAEFIDEIPVPEDDPHFLRGSTRKRRYRWKRETMLGLDSIQ